ncbi:MAG: TIM44-like domain-containing protein [Coriobacteriia bacterium]|nr:TIM44-like domain-containing protein [Coriobacteriia bacterium]
MTRTKWMRLAAVALVALLVVALFVPLVASGRAGGGQSSNPGRSGGSSSFGGSSGGSSGGSGMGGALAGAAVGSALSGGGGSSGGCCGFIFLVIIIIVVFAVIQGMKKKGLDPEAMLNDMASQAAAPPPAPMAPADFSVLKDPDTAFSEQLFYGRVNEMFLAIQEAWEARNMEPARRFLSQQQFEVLKAGVDEYVTNGQINKLDNVHIDKITPVSVSREGDADYVKVMLTATIIDYTVDERTGQIVNPGVMGDGKTPKTFDEYWTLTRKVGAITKADATIKKCPNCGGPVTDGNYVKCAYCGTMMNDPALDWVLLRIEQP